MSEKIISSDTAYNEKFAINQTSLKEFKTLPPSEWHKMFVTRELPRPKKSATTLGSFLDCLMFTPEDVDKRFVVSTVGLPSEKVQTILDEAFNHVNELNKNATLINKENPKNKKIPMKPHTLEDRDLITSLCIKHQHYEKKADTQGYNDVIKKGAEYFNFLQSTRGRKVIAPAENISAVELQKILLEDKISKPFFTPKKGCEVVFQQRIFSEFDLTGFNNLDFLPVKGALDIIHFNHKRKEVREVDLKCSDAFMFIDSVRRFDYGTQHSFYDFLLKEWLKKYKDGIYKDYVVMNPLNLVIDPTLKTPYIYGFNQDDLHIKRYGIEGTPIKGWEDTINTIAWHFDNADWSRPREHIMNGYMSINIFNKR